MGSTVVGASSIIAKNISSHLTSKPGNNYINEAASGCGPKNYDLQFTGKIQNI